jgi:hypothetical protein
MHEGEIRWMNASGKDDMGRGSPGDEAAIRYLLGEMEEEEKTALEKSLFEGEDAFERVAAAEDELIDDYLHEELSAQERTLFEKSYLASPERRQRVEFARTLEKRLREGSAARPILAFRERSSRQSRFLLAAAALVLAAIGAYFAAASVRARQELRRLEAEKTVVSRRERDLERQIAEARGHDSRLAQELARERAEKERLAQELASLQARSAKSVSFTLIAGLVRDSGTLQTLRIPSDAANIRLTLPVADPSYASYHAVIQTPEGKEIWRGEATRQISGKSLMVVVPSQALQPGDYILSLTGTTASGRPEPAADFSFRVKKS